MATVGFDHHRKVTTNHRKKDVEPTLETSCISNMSQTMNNVRHNVGIMHKPFRASHWKKLQIKYARLREYVFCKTYSYILYEISMYTYNEAVVDKLHEIRFGLHINRGYSGPTWKLHHSSWCGEQYRISSKPAEWLGSVDIPCPCFKHFLRRQTDIDLVRNSEFHLGLRWFLWSSWIVVSAIPVTRKKW